MFDGILAEQRIVDMQRRATRIAIDIFDALILKEAGDHIGAGKQFHCVSPLEVSSAVSRPGMDRESRVRRYAAAGQAGT
ncbi:hypothetical protein GCM10023342_26740 [Modicisalibacter zincidurans]|uniref:Uncharacterized protein n=1 Tax=Modicisalibacter zincidurans TaxID=1178777 RepID=A0ABP9RHE5_9GAMM